MRSTTQCCACSCPAELGPSGLKAGWTRAKVRKVVNDARTKRWRAPATGGLADGRLASDFPREALVEGVLVELEHTRDPMLALRISMDHLVESRDYYRYLESMEKRMESARRNPGHQARAPQRLREPRGTYELVVINPVPSQYPEAPSWPQRSELSLEMRRLAMSLGEEARKWPPKRSREGIAIAKRLVERANMVKRLGEFHQRKAPPFNVEKAVEDYRRAEDMLDLAEGNWKIHRWDYGGGPPFYTFGEEVEDWRGTKGHVVSVVKEVKGKPNRVVVDWVDWGLQSHHPNELGPFDVVGKSLRAQRDKAAQRVEGRRPAPRAPSEPKPTPRKKRKAPPRAGAPFPSEEALKKSRPLSPRELPTKAKLPKEEERVWATAYRAPPEVKEGYTHLIWGPDDPPRSERPKKGGREDIAPHLTLKKTPVAEHERKIMRLMRDGKARTFNAIGVIVYDKNASILFEGPVNDALWNLVERGELEHSQVAPILFRKRTKESFVPRGIVSETPKTVKKKAKSKPSAKPRAPAKEPSLASRMGGESPLAAWKKATKKPARKKQSRPPEDVLGAWRKARGK